ncbi:transposase, partial [Legionella geestiana]
MTDYNITVGEELIPELLTSQGGLAKLVESVLNQILEAQATETLVAGRYERNEERAGYRNGYRARQLYT